MVISDIISNFGKSSVFEAKMQRKDVFLDLDDSSWRYALKEAVYTTSPTILEGKIVVPCGCTQRRGEKLADRVS